MSRNFDQIMIQTVSDGNLLTLSNLILLFETKNAKSITAITKSFLKLQRD
jgi:hypothetical protein